MHFDLSIPLRFNGPQPNAFGVETACSEPVRAGEFIGDTRLGGSINFEQYTFIPHCNGTHTECVGHITHERISVRDILKDIFIPALLVSVEPEILGKEKTITSISLKNIGLKPPGASGEISKEPTALIVRTLPNDKSKLTADYNKDNIPPYFTPDAMQSIIDAGFTHLLCDLPSIDRIYDEGKLINHRIFWNVEEGSFETNPKTRLNSTITELIYVPNDVTDGHYLLNLQIPPFESDCAPSRPVLIKKD
ncbi:cyclase family protein [Leptolyngbya sp. 7M]|uniref:cyclase family protein n=1 Tax=Leptolyngbya sp. 7M TaxID=2812896 RepID=UPI001B8AFA33|nr:cyclase family protein [Leptolyngbya sp. 7M]QYO66251.1 cyclase family protein [Leptolyngbya sp. 7M]